MLPLIKKRKIPVTRDDLEILLQNNDLDAPPEIIKLDPATQRICNDMGMIEFKFLVSFLSSVQSNA